MFFCVSIGWSYLAWRVDSIRPGIVIHTVIDAAAFLWAIFRPQDLARVAATSLVEQGLTPGYRLLTGIASALVIATVAAFVMLHRRTGPRGAVPQTRMSGAPEWAQSPGCDTTRM